METKLYEYEKRINSELLEMKESDPEMYEVSAFKTNF